MVVAIAHNCEIAVADPHWPLLLDCALAFPFVVSVCAAASCELVSRSVPVLEPIVAVVLLVTSLALFVWP